ncbi:MAG: hypothetical protein AAB229_00100 [Candidatus Hydrogenedentota bacterium]
MRILKSIRLTDAAIFLALLAILAGLFIRIRHPDAVSRHLTDLTLRRTFMVELAVPYPWRRPPLSEMPCAGDFEEPEGGRDRAEFVRLALADTDTNSPRAVFRLTARVDPEGAIWYNYGRVLPGASFMFHTSTYAMEGIILSVQPDGGEP